MKSPWICHNCGRYGHIRPYCYKLYGYPQPRDKPKVSGKIVQARKEWKPKTPNVKPSVKSYGMVSIVADNIDTSKKIASKTGNLDNLRTTETLGQSNLNVVDAGSTIEEGAFLSPSKTAIAPDVTTSLAQHDHIKFESESVYDNEKSQSKKVSDHENVNYVFVGDEKDGSESDDQSVWSLLLF